MDSARTFLGWIPAGPVALVLEGEAGIGKTSLLKDTVAAAQARSWPVLTAQPTSSETGLPFAALTDLLSGLGPQALDALPGPQRRAMDVVLLRADPEAAVPDSRALATGFVSVLTALARRSPLVVAVDDVQWLDKPSARVASSLSAAWRTCRSASSPVPAPLSKRPSALALIAPFRRTGCAICGWDRFHLPPLSR